MKNKFYFDSSTIAANQHTYVTHGLKEFKLSFFSISIVHTTAMNTVCVILFKRFPKKERRPTQKKLSIKEFSGSLVKCNKNIFVYVENDK